MTRRLLMVKGVKSPQKTSFIRSSATLIRKNRSQGSWLWTGKIVGVDDWKANGSDYSKTIEGVQALDSHTVQIKLIKPFPQLTYTLAMGYSSIVPVEAVEKYGRELSVHPVGFWSVQTGVSQQHQNRIGKKYRLPSRNL